MIPIFKLYVKKRKTKKGYRYNLELFKDNKYVKSMKLNNDNFGINDVANLCNGLDTPDPNILYYDYYKNSNCIICGKPLKYSCYGKTLKVCSKECYMENQRRRKRKNQINQELKEFKRTNELKSNFEHALPSDFNQVDNPKKLGIHYKSFSKPLNKDNPDWDFEMDTIKREIMRVKRLGNKKIYNYVSVS